jgi:hypothetical protein
MFESMKRAVLAGVVVAVAALAVPAMASAAEWDVDGTPVGGSPGVSVAGGGNFGFTAQVAPGVFSATSCDVAVEADVWNASGVGSGSVTDFDLQEPTCVVTGVPNCAVSSVVPSMPWTLTTSGSTVTFGNVSFVYTMVGSSCALAGSRLVTGSVTGDWYDPGTLDPTFPGMVEYANAPGLTIAGLVPTVANGWVDLAPVNGGDLYLR